MSDCVSLLLLDGEIGRAMQRSLNETRLSTTFCEEVCFSCTELAWQGHILLSEVSDRLLRLELSSLRRCLVNSIGIHSTGLRHL